MARKRPNILWICTDQQRFDTLGCTGNRFVKTPYIDALAKQSAHFTHCYVQSPVCMPSRGSFLTGRYPRTTRLRQNGQSIPDTEKPISRLLSDQGYYCGLVGKFHLSPADPNVNETIEQRINDGYDEFCWAGDPHDNWGNHSGYTSFLADQGARFETSLHPDCAHVDIGMPLALHETTWCAEQAIEFIERRKNEDEPWLFSANLFAPHHPFDPPAEFLDRYSKMIDQIPLPEALDEDLSSKPAYQKYDAEGAYGQTMTYGRNLSDRDHRMVRAAYWAMCDLVDHAVGRMLEALKRSGQEEDTIVIFMSDHGEMLGDHGIYLKGPYFYEPAIRVPFMIRHPSRVSPGINDGLMELVDLAPTLMDACGFDQEPGMQGSSLWPQLQSSTPVVGRESIYCEYYNAMPFHAEPTAQLTMIRTKSHKLIVDHAHDDGELYDLDADPGEIRNLWSDPDWLEIKADLLTQLTHRMAFTADPLPPRICEW